MLSFLKVESITRLGLHMISLWKAAGGALWEAYLSGTELRGTFKKEKKTKTPPGRRQNKLGNLLLLLMPTRGRLRVIGTQNPSP